MAKHSTSQFLPEWAERIFADAVDPKHRATDQPRVSFAPVPAVR